MRPVAAVDHLFEAHLIVGDLDASIAFYRDRLGLELAQVIPARRAAFFWIGSRGNSILDGSNRRTSPACTMMLCRSVEPRDSFFSSCCNSSTKSG